MNTSEPAKILKKINCTKNTFGGVYPSNLLPLEVKPSPESFVANVNTSEKLGSQWVAFYFTDDQHGEFLDSYGLPPHRYTKYFEDFLNRNASYNRTYNRKHLQSFFTDVCGHLHSYSAFIAFIYNRCHNGKMNTIVNMFPLKVKEDNDALACYVVECKLVVREIVKSSSCLKLQCCKPIR